MTYSEARKMPIQEFHLEAVLKELELNMDEVCEWCSTGGHHPLEGEILRPTNSHGAEQLHVNWNFDTRVRAGVT